MQEHFYDSYCKSITLSMQYRTFPLIANHFRLTLFFILHSSFFILYPFASIAWQAVMATM